METVYIMWLRQIKKYWRSKPRMIGSLGQPILFLVALGFGFGHIYQDAVGGSYIDFLVPGIHMHMRPGKGKPRNVAKYIADMMFPETKENGK